MRPVLCAPFKATFHHGGHAARSAAVTAWRFVIVHARPRFPECSSLSAPHFDVSASSVAGP